MVNSNLTERLLIRPRTMDDIDACMAMDRDPLVTEFISGPWDDPVLHRAFLIERMTTPFPYPLGYWTITSREAPEEFLGWVMLLPTNADTPTAEIGWRLTRKTWGQGIATEATRCVLQLLKDHSPDTNVTASIHASNTGSIKVAQKIGMVFSHEEMIDGVAEHIYRRNCVNS